MTSFLRASQREQDKVETNVNRRIFVIIVQLEDTANVVGSNVPISVRHELVNAAEALLQTTSPFKPDGAPHV